jgi:putative transposase
MNLFPAVVSLSVQAMLLSARWAGRRRHLCLEQAAGVSDHSRVAELEARLLLLEDALALRDAHIEVLEQRLQKSAIRRPYEPTERLRILWLCEYFQIPRRRLREMLGVSRSSVHRWLEVLRDGRFGNRARHREPANKTPQDIVALVWETFGQNPGWGRHRMAMALWAMGVFLAPSTVRDILLRARPQEPLPAARSVRKRCRGPVRITATAPNQTWSLDSTRVWRWGIWPTWVLVAVDHLSRMATSVSALYGSDGGSVIEAMESAFRRHGAPMELVSDKDSVFTSGAFQQLLRRWGVRHRFGTLGRQGSVAVAERAILTLKGEWLRRVGIIRGADHLEPLLREFAVYYNEYRGHMTLGGATPEGIHRRVRWERPDRSAKTVPPRIERRQFAEARVTAFRLAA